jgi:RimJ/RimL family protein N-acetyltransferase
MENRWISSLDPPDTPGMDVTLYADATEFAAASRGFLAVHAPEVNILATALADVLAGSYPGAVWAITRNHGGEVAGVAMRVPPYPVWLSPHSASAAAALAQTWHSGGRAMPGVNGERKAVEVFVERWTELTGDRLVESAATRLYVLDLLVQPAVPGRPRPVRADDQALVTSWLEAFLAEAVHAGPREDAPAVADRLLQSGNGLLWTDLDGRPASMAWHRAPAAGVSRVGPVYTPPEFRRRGYASAVTAAASQAALDAGAGRVCLYTDLANPTSNAIYQAIGFRPRLDSVETVPA